jgi:hypothetical protein
MMEVADMRVLNTREATRAGSWPAARTNLTPVAQLVGGGCLKSSTVGVQISPGVPIMKAVSSEAERGSK